MLIPKNVLIPLNNKETSNTFVLPDKYVRMCKNKSEFKQTLMLLIHIIVYQFLFAVILFTD